MTAFFKFFLFRSLARRELYQEVYSVWPLWLVRSRTTLRL